MPVGPSLFTPVWRVNAQVAFHGYIFHKIPDCPVGFVRAGLDTAPAADAFVFIDSPDIAVGNIHMTRACRAILHAQRGDALPAYRHDDVVWVLGKGWSIANYLDSGQRGICHPFMHHGAGKHATLAA
jgi:hypothetical protein